MPEVLVSLHPSIQTDTQQPAEGEDPAKIPSEGLRCAGNTRNEEAANCPALRPRSAII